MKKLLLCIFLLPLLVRAQTVETVITLPNGGGSYQSLLYTPTTYGSGSTKYPLLVFVHGAGQSNAPLSNIYNNATAGGPAYFMEHGGWPTSFTNPADGLAYQMLVISPQAQGSGWSSSGPQLDAMIQYMVTTYRVDVNRIYLTGLSAGGAGIVQYLIHQDDNGASVTPAKWKAAAWVPMSEAFGAPNQTAMNVAVADSGFAWGFGDAGNGGNNDSHGFDTQTILTEMNNTRPGIARFTNYSGGHCCWGTYYNPNYREVIGGVSMNIYEWMLQFSRGVASTAPTANAGSPQTITLPTSTCTLTGTGTPAAGHSITTYAWTKFSGPTGGTISSAATASTGITALQQGTYVFLLTVTQNDGQTATSTVTITVNSGTPVCIVGPNQTINLPTNSVTLTASASTGTITTYAWTKTSGGAATIVSASSATTSITGLVQGQYIFQCSLNSGASTAKDTVTVNNVPQPYGSPVNSVAPTSASITVNNQSFTSGYTLDSATLSGITYSKFSVPGQTAKKLGVIGSSTMEGNGASTTDSSVIGRTTKYYNTAGLLSTTTNIAITGENVYQGMPTGFVPSGTITAKLSPTDVPDTNDNVTKILQSNPDVVIIGFPSNGVEAGLTLTEYMFALRTEYNYIVAAGKACFIGTPQPREDFTAGQMAILQQIRDSVLAQFGTHALNFWSGVTVPGGTARLGIYADPASQYHLNDSGHNVLFHVVQAANIFSSFATSASVITTPNQQNTTVTGLPNGVNKFQVSVQDSHGQFSTAVSTITVTVAGAPVSNAGADQSIVLPTTSVTLDGTGSTGTITSRSWTRISGPNSPSFATPTTATCVVSGLVAGVYAFQLALNGGASVSTTNVNVLPIPACSHNVVMITPDPTDSSYFGTPSVSPGDTIKLNDNGKAFSTIEFDNVNGSQMCPITIKADKSLGRAVRIRGFHAQLKLFSCTYIHITGGGIPGIKYGINASYEADTAQKWNWQTASGSFFHYAINGRSKNITLDSCYSHHAAIGIEVKEDGGCDTTLNKNGNPNDWVIDSITIHDMYIKGPWNEGMYIGNTSPDNRVNSYDPRPVVCGGSTTYPRPMRIGYVHVYNNLVDSSGRGGIQIASGNGTAIEVDHNTVLHAGMNGDDGQGTGISIGTYISGYIHDNVIRCSLDWLFASLGGGVTGQPIRLINNLLDSAGHNNYYQQAATHVDGATQAQEPNLFTIVQNGPGNTFFASFSNAIYFGTRPVDSLPALDSVSALIEGNKIGIFNDAGGGNTSTHVENGFVIGNFYNYWSAAGTFFCNNTGLDGITPVTTIQNSNGGSPLVPFSTNCAGATAPTVNIPIARAVIQPATSIALSGVATPAAGLNISTYLWTQLSGPTAVIDNTAAANINITGLTVALNAVYTYYTFKLTVVQSDGQQASSTIQVIAELASFGKHIGRRVIFK